MFQFKTIGVASNQPVLFAMDELLLSAEKQRLPLFEQA
jgi:hypothetical protein